MNKRPPNYDPEAVKPMWQELALVGMESLTEPEQVEKLVSEPGTALVVVNSVCGCAAGNARPGSMLALQYDKIPDRLGTVFAGMDHEAVDAARGFMTEVPPSSPCIALFKDGKAVVVLERRHIEMMSAADVANALVAGFEEHCTRQGPSISREEFEKIIPISQCGSSIPAYVAGGGGMNPTFNEG